MNLRRMVLALLPLSATNTNAATAYDTILFCEGQSTNWMTGAPVKAKIAIVPAKRTDRSLWAGYVDDTEPLANGVGLGFLEWDDGVLGVRRDRAVQLTQPTNDSTLYEPIDMPLVVIGFRASSSASIPLVVHVEVHKRGIPWHSDHRMHRPDAAKKLALAGSSFSQGNPTHSTSVPHGKRVSRPLWLDA